MDDISIEFKNVSKQYRLFKNNKQRLRFLLFRSSDVRKKLAVNNVSFVISKGESVALIGNNGAGKSTVLKMISQVTYPTSGEITVNGTIGALIELTAGFDPEFTGRENIYLRGVILGLDRAYIDTLIKPIEDFAELGEYIEQPVRTYSSGMKARLGFAININLKPDILIVDEALSVGDANFKRKCNETIKDYLSQKKTTLLFVTHSAVVASQFCERGIVINKGKVAFDGPISEALRKYKNINARRKKSAAKKLLADKQKNIATQ